MGDIVRSLKTGCLLASPHRPPGNITREDKLLLAFDALALGTVFISAPTSGVIVHGLDRRTVTVKLSALMKTVSSCVAEISQRLTQPPAHQLNRHCSQCSFQTFCHGIATTKDDLSLLSNMNKREQNKFAGKGIFTVTQLSYTFRPRRRPAKQRSVRPPYSHPLKALAIRDRKIYVNGPPCRPHGHASDRLLRCRRRRRSTVLLSCRPVNLRWTLDNTVLVLGGLAVGGKTDVGLLPSRTGCS
jgi:hypothetical protein